MASLRARFERIFTRKTGFVTLDRLLARLHANKRELHMVLDRPEIPLHTSRAKTGLRAAITPFVVLRQPADCSGLSAQRERGSGINKQGNRAPSYI
jgi:hypothetical protein